MRRSAFAFLAFWLSLVLALSALATVSTTTNSVTAQGNGVTYSFSYSFVIPNTGDLVVIFTDTNGTQTTLSATQYTVTGIGSSAGGTVTYPLSGSPIASGTSLTIERVVPYTQTTSIANQGPTFKAIESGLDNTVYQTQQLANTVTRSIQIPSSDSGVNTVLPVASVRANMCQAFDGSGNVIATPCASTGYPISSVMLPVVQAATLAAGRLAFGNVPTAPTTTTTHDFATYSGVTGAALEDVYSPSNTANHTVLTTAGSGFTTGHLLGAADSKGTPSDLGGFPTGYRYGCTFSTAGSSTTFTMAAPCIAADSTGSILMTLSASISKTTGSWAVGTGKGCLDTGSIANSTWYHIYQIERTDTGVVDEECSLAAPPTGPALPSGYSKWRWVGVDSTDGSGNWTSITQKGNVVYLATYPTDLNAAAADTNAHLQTLSVPSGITVFALGTAFLNGGGTSNGSVFISSPLMLDGTPIASSTPATPLLATAVSYNIGFAIFPGSYRLLTNTSGQIRYRASNTASTITLTTIGWEIPANAGY